MTSTPTITAADVAAYERYCLEATLTEAPPIPSPIDREHVANVCELCHQAPTAANPTTRWAGAPADLENGPSADELPFTVCERCEFEEG